MGQARQESFELPEGTPEFYVDSVDIQTTRNPKLKASYERAKQDAATGNIRRFSNVEDLIADLNTE